jgi:hypothetical protein
MLCVGSYPALTIVEVAAAEDDHYVIRGVVDRGLLLARGTTSGGGTHGYGTVFRLSMGLARFVKPLPAFGRVAATVTILGTNLTGASSVTFHGKPAQFTVVSPTAITATVPSGATTGV